MSLKDTEKLVNLEGLTTYTQMLNVKQEAQNNKIAQIVGELAGATAQLTKTTAKVDCDHRYEITGATNDEHNLAIDDQQMLINKISGRTLVRNQLFDYYMQDTETGINAWTVVDNVYTFNYTNNTGETQYKNIAYSSATQFILGHKYAFITRGIVQNIVFYFAEGDMQVGKSSSTIFECIEEPKQTSQIQLLCKISDGATISGTTTLELIDLTLAYRQGNEPTTVEEVLNDFPDYIEYNEGTFVHSNNKLISTGKNLWKLGDQNFTQEKYIYLDKPIKAGTYTISAFITSTDTDESKCVMAFYGSHTIIGNYINGAFFDRNIRSSVKVVFNKDVYTISLRAAENYGTSAGDTVTWKDIQIEYGEVATDYEPYKEEVIEGIGELKAFDYVDNETDSTIYGSREIDMGDLLWKYIADVDFFYTSQKDRKIGDKNIRCTGYDVKSPFSNDNCIYGNSSDIELYLRNTSFNGDAIALKESLKGVKLLYELAQPTTTESNLPAGMSVYKNGMQIQEGTIPYVIEKQYALSIASQVVQNIEIDREQQKQIDNMKVDIDHKQPLLFSGQNIKTFNGKSMLGSGDLAWNDPMFLAKFNDVTDYVNENSGIIDELLEGKTYRIYSDNDASSSVYSFNVRLKLKISSGDTKMYTIALPTKTKNFVDFRLDNIVINGQTATLYYNVDNVDYTQTLTQQGDAVVGDYEIYGWGALYLSGTYAAVFEPVEVATKEDFDALTSDEQPLDSLQDYVEEGYTEFELNKDYSINLHNVSSAYRIGLNGYKCYIYNIPDVEIEFIGNSSLNGPITLYNYANIPNDCFTFADKGQIGLDKLKTNNVNQLLVEYKNNCFILRNVFVGGI